MTRKSHRVINVTVPGEDYTISLLELVVETNNQGHILRSDCFAYLTFLDGNEKKVRISYHCPLETNNLSYSDFYLIETGELSIMTKALLASDKLVVHTGPKRVKTHPHFPNMKIRAAMFFREDDILASGELRTFLIKIHPYLPGILREKALAYAEALKLHAMKEAF